MKVSRNAHCVLIPGKIPEDIRPIEYIDFAKGCGSKRVHCLGRWPVDNAVNSWRFSRT